MQLVGVTTPVAGTAEVHEMKMEGDVMRMRPVPKVDLPAGRTVEFKPGGYHLMLMDLKQALKPGSHGAADPGVARRAGAPSASWN